MSGLAKDFQGGLDDGIILLKTFVVGLDLHIGGETLTFDAGAIKTKVFPTRKKNYDAVAELHWLGIPGTSGGMIADEDAGRALLHHHHERFAATDSALAHQHGNAALEVGAGFVRLEFPIKRPEPFAVLTIDILCINDGVVDETSGELLRQILGTAAVGPDINDQGGVD